MKKDKAGPLMAIVTSEVSEATMATIEAMFDEVTDIEERAMLNNQDTTKLLKTYLAIRLGIFPFHWLLLRIFLGKNDAKYFFQLNKQFFQVIRMEEIDDSTLYKFLEYAF